jgi:hypothetical protein
MTVGTHEHAVLADDVYLDRSNKSGKEVTIDGVNYKILALASHPSGYRRPVERKTPIAGFSTPSAAPPPLRI